MLKLSERRSGVCGRCRRGYKVRWDDIKHTWVHSVADVAYRFECDAPLAIGPKDVMPAVEASPVEKVEVTPC